MFSRIRSASSSARAVAACTPSPIPPVAAWTRVWAHTCRRDVVALLPSQQERSIFCCSACCLAATDDQYILNAGPPRSVGRAISSGPKSTGMWFLKTCTTILTPMKPSARFFLPKLARNPADISLLRSSNVKPAASRMSYIVLTFLRSCSSISTSCANVDRTFKVARTFRSASIVSTIWPSWIAVVSLAVLGAPGEILISKVGVMVRGFFPPAA